MPCRHASPAAKTGNVFPETNRASLQSVRDWSFLTNHARVLLCIAHDPGARLRDIAASLGITERTAHGILTDLAEAGYVVKHRDGRRNRYRIQAHLPLPEPTSREPAIGEVLAVLLGHKDGKDGLAGPAGLAAADRLGGGPADGGDALTARIDGHAAPGGLEGDDRPGPDPHEEEILPRRP
jgi:DNA-binding transcriptional ArsR family regulator